MHRLQASTPPSATPCWRTTSVVLCAIEKSAIRTTVAQAASEVTGRSAARPAVAACASPDARSEGNMSAITRLRCPRRCLSHPFTVRRLELFLPQGRRHEWRLGLRFQLLRHRVSAGRVYRLPASCDLSLPADRACRAGGEVLFLGEINAQPRPEGGRRPRLGWATSTGECSPNNSETAAARLPRMSSVN